MHVLRFVVALPLLGLALACSNGRALADGGASSGTPDSPVCNTQMSVCHWTATFGFPIPDWTDCPGFTVSANFLADRQYTVFYDASGNPTRELRHVSFTGTLTNTSTGAWVTYEGHFLREYDYTTDTLRITGLSERITLPSGRSIVIDSGYVGDVTHGRADDSVICSVLA